MNIIKFASAAALATLMFGSISATAEPQNAQQFKRSMQNASKARLNSNGSTVLRTEVEQDVTARKTTLVGSSLRTNNVTVDDSLIGTLDIDQDATLRNVSTTYSSSTINEVSMTRARSQMTEIDQTATVRTLNAIGSSVAANTVTVR